jgi:glycosyltransferase involved in cell wall biosynthesis
VNWTSRNFKRKIASGVNLKKKVSIVVPVFNEEENLEKLSLAVEGALKPTGRPFELILIDDGSSDKSWEALIALQKIHKWISCLGLVRNYGQSTALQAGFDYAQGEYIVTLDGDLQNDPEDIPMMLDYLDKNPDVDCVSGWRKLRQDSTFTRKIPSKIANFLISKATKVSLNDYGCALKAYRAEVITNLRLYGELHRFIPALAVEVGARVVEVPVNHRARTAGYSKYGIDRTVRVLLDLLWIRFTMRFLHRPMHAFGTPAILLVSIGTGSLIWLAFEKFMLGQDIGGRPLLLFGVLMTLVGVQLLGTGLIGELLTRIYHEPQGRKQYLLRIERDRQSVD